MDPPDPPADPLTSARLLHDEVCLLVAHAASHCAIPSLSFLSVRAAALAAEIQAEIKVVERNRSRQQPPTNHNHDPNAHFKPDSDSDSDPSAAAAAATAVASSNIPFYAAVWDTAKRASNLVAVRHKVSSLKRRPAGSSSKAKRKSWTCNEMMFAPGLRVSPSIGQCHKDPQLMIDVVADTGLTWWKVSTINNRRLLFDLAKEDLLHLGAGEDGGLAEALEEVEAFKDDGEYGDVPLVKMVREYLHAAKRHRIRGRSPIVHIVLPRVDELAETEIAMLVACCRRLGAIVHTAQQIPPVSPQLCQDLLNIMAPSPFAAFTDVLNIDTSIIVALASDFSHANVDIQDWFSRSHSAHCEKERSHKMMHEVLPALQGHDLVCTEEVATTFQHVVTTTGTDTEIARAAIILDIPIPSTSSLTSSAARVAALQQLSIYPIPSTLRLPIRAVPLTPELKPRVPPVAQDVLARNPDMLQPGLSVFQYSWACGLTTITANLVSARALGRDLELDGRMVDDADWPKVWIASASRPLVGVPKSRRTRVHVLECEGGCVCGIDRFHGGRTYEDDERKEEKEAGIKDKDEGENRSKEDGQKEEQGERSGVHEITDAVARSCIT